MKQNTSPVNASLPKLRMLALTLLLLGPFAGMAQLTVYPGDANSNGLCSHVDVLYLGLTFGGSGPARGGSINWVPQTLQTPWNQSTPDGTNYGYSDCNGNGTIDSVDMQAINLNFGQITQPAGPGDTLIPLTGTASTLSINLPQDSLPIQGTTSFTAEINLGTSFFPIDSIYGVAFTIAYDPTIVDQVTVNPHGGWLANSTQVLSLGRVDSMAGLIYVAITNTDHLNRSGFGAIASIGIVMDDNIRISGQFELELDVVYVRAFYASGNNVPMIGQGDSMTMLTTAIKSGAEPEIEISPNPASDMVRVAIPSAEIGGIRLLDISGREIKRFQAISTGQNLLDLSGTRPGVYFLEFRTSQGIFRKKILRMP